MGEGERQGRAGEERREERLLVIFCALLGIKKQKKCNNHSHLSPPTPPVHTHQSPQTHLSTLLHRCRQRSERPVKVGLSAGVRAGRGGRWKVVNYFSHDVGARRGQNYLCLYLELAAESRVEDLKIGIEI